MFSRASDGSSPTGHRFGKVQEPTAGMSFLSEDYARVLRLRFGAALRCFLADAGRASRENHAHDLDRRTLSKI